jgi:uncharacterized protein
VLDAIGHALAVAGSMTWQITWSLILGFTLSAVVQAVVRRGASFTAAMAFEIASTNLVIELGVILALLPSR